MIFSRRIICVLFLAPIALIFPLSLRAQEPISHKSDRSIANARKNSAGRSALNEQRRRGEALFVENCTLCHMPSDQKKKLGIQTPLLEGVYGEGADSDGLRQFIQQGVPGKMPGFSYGLDPNEIDDLVAYLKTGAHLKAASGGN